MESCLRSVQSAASRNSHQPPKHPFSQNIGQERSIAPTRRIPAKTAQPPTPGFKVDDQSKRCAFAVHPRSPRRHWRQRPHAIQRESETGYGTATRSRACRLGRSSDAILGPHEVGPCLRHLATNAAMPVWRDHRSRGSAQRRGGPDEKENEKTIEQRRNCSLGAFPKVDRGVQRES